MHNNGFPQKIAGRKPDSEAGCIFENFTPKQGNSLKILAAGTRNHGLSLPLGRLGHTKTMEDQTDSKQQVSISVPQSLCSLEVVIACFIWI